MAWLEPELTTHFVHAELNFHEFCLCWFPEEKKNTILLQTTENWFFEFCDGTRLQLMILNKTHHQCRNFFNEFRVLGLQKTGTPHYEQHKFLFVYLLLLFGFLMHQIGNLEPELNKHTIHTNFNKYIFVVVGFSNANDS